MVKYYEKFQKILNAADAETLELIKDQFSNFAQYSLRVCDYVTKGEIAKKTLGGDALREEMQNLDESRHNAHEAAISSLNMLNRLGSSYIGEPFADVDTCDRYAVADFVGEFVQEVYAGEIARTKGKTA